LARYDYVNDKYNPLKYFLNPDELFKTPYPFEHNVMALEMRATNSMSIFKVAALNDDVNVWLEPKITSSKSVL
jgi:hypothetical protein